MVTAVTIPPPSLTQRRLLHTMAMLRGMRATQSTIYEKNAHAEAVIAAEVLSAVAVISTPIDVAMGAMSAATAVATHNRRC